MTNIKKPQDDGKPQRSSSSFIDQQRQSLNGIIEDQIGPSANLEEVISGNPPLPDEAITEPQLTRIKHKK